jgi:YggT family protein
VFVIGNLLQALATIIDYLLQALFIVIFINALLSFVRPDPYNPIVRFLDRISDLVCDPIRRLLPTTISGIDFAPFIAMLVIWFLRMFLVATLRDLAFRMG